MRLRFLVVLCIRWDFGRNSGMVQKQPGGFAEWRKISLRNGGMAYPRKPPVSIWRIIYSQTLSFLFLSKAIGLKKTLGMTPVRGSILTSDIWYRSIYISFLLCFIHDLFNAATYFQSNNSISSTSIPQLQFPQPATPIAQLAQLAQLKTIIVLKLFF